MIAERGKEGAGRIGSRKAENRRGPTPGVAAPAEIGHPARGDNARPRKEGDAQAPGMRVTFQPHAGGGAADTANGPGVGGSGQGALQFLNDFRDHVDHISQKDDPRRHDHEKQKKLPDGAI